MKPLTKDTPKNNTTTTKKQQQKQQQQQTSQARKDKSNSPTQSKRVKETTSLQGTKWLNLYWPQYVLCSHNLLIVEIKIWSHEHGHI